MVGARELELLLAESVGARRGGTDPVREGGGGITLREGGGGREEGEPKEEVEDVSECKLESEAPLSRVGSGGVLELESDEPDLVGDPGGMLGARDGIGGAVRTTGSVAGVKLSAGRGGITGREGTIGVAIELSDESLNAGEDGSPWLPSASNGSPSSSSPARLSSDIDRGVATTTRCFSSEGAATPA